MKRKDVYVGVLRRCTEKNIIKDVKNNKEIVRFNTSIFRCQAVLIKVENGKYIWLRNVKTMLDEVKVELGINNKFLYSYPEYVDGIYVDENTLIPLYEKHEDKKVRVRTLKKDIIYNPKIVKEFGVTIARDVEN